MFLCSRHTYGADLFIGGSSTAHKDNEANLFIGGSSTAHKDDVKTQKTNDGQRRNSSDNQDTDTDNGKVNVSQRSRFLYSSNN